MFCPDKQDPLKHSFPHSFFFAYPGTTTLEAFYKVFTIIKIEKSGRVDIRLKVSDRRTLLLDIVQIILFTETGLK